MKTVNINKMSVETPIAHLRRGDACTEVIRFRISRSEYGTDLSGMTWSMRLNNEHGEVYTSYIGLAAEVTTEYVNVDWTVPAAAAAVPGYMFIQLSGVSGDNEWASGIRHILVHEALPLKVLTNAEVQTLDDFLSDVSEEVNDEITDMQTDISTFKTAVNAALKENYDACNEISDIGGRIIYAETVNGGIADNGSNATATNTKRSGYIASDEYVQYRVICDTVKYSWKVFEYDTDKTFIASKSSSNYGGKWFTPSAGTKYLKLTFAGVSATDVVTADSAVLITRSDVYSELTNGYVTPEMFGAAADGTTDDTAAIQKALNASTDVRFTGTYYVTDTLTVQEKSALTGKGTIKTNCAAVFADMKGVRITGIRFTNANTDDYVNTYKLFSKLDGCFIQGCRAAYYSSFMGSCVSCTKIIGNNISYLKASFGNATDSFIIGNYINASKLTADRSIMMRSINNTCFGGNFCDYWWTCFRLQAGNKTSQITGNTFDDCVSVFRDFVTNVTITGNTFSNIKYIESKWNVAPPESVRNDPWGIFVFEKTTASSSGATENILSDTVFTGNQCRDVSYYIYTSPCPYLQGNCRFDCNSVQDAAVSAGFIVSATGRENGYVDSVYFDFWHDRVFDTLPDAKLTGTSSSSPVVSYNRMECYKGSDKYINISGTWYKYTLAAET